jgi:hypothetical protein
MVATPGGLAPVWWTPWLRGHEVHCSGFDWCPRSSTGRLATLTAPAKEFERLLMAHPLRHTGSPVVRSMVAKHHRHDGRRREHHAKQGEVR